MELTCRTCLRKTDNSSTTKMHLIYEETSMGDCDNTKFEEIRLKLERLTGKLIKLEKTWPNRICQTCLESLYAAHDFQMMCIENQEKLENIKLEETIESYDLNYTFGHNSEEEIANFDSETEQKNKIISETLREEAIDYVEKEIKNSTIRKKKSRKRITTIKAVHNKVQKQNSHKSQKTLQKAASSRETKRDPVGEVQNSLEAQNNDNRTAIAPTSAKSLALKVICEICGLKFRNESVLTLHMRRHLQIKPFECETCRKSFVSKQQLKRHMRVHTGDRPYTCKFCDRKFGDLSTIIRHERTHTKERPYVCKCCNKSFTRLSCMKDHLVAHTGEKQFRCDPCKKIFGNNKLLKQHMGTLVHKQVVTSECKKKT